MGSAYDLVIVGMGSAGIVAAEFAAALGLRVTAVERDRVGGDCLWTGCVPSKALLASARAAHTLRRADRYGLPASDPDIDTAWCGSGSATCSATSPPPTTTLSGSGRWESS
ncbi:MAG: FAD-dependent oxidoreductase [Acidimicrobiia bacterium]